MASTRNELYQTIQQALVLARKNAGITQVQLAKRIGQRQTFVSKFELGERRLDAAEVIQIARALGADPYALMKKAERAIAND